MKMTSSELRKGFAPSYFCLEDILASQTRVPCQTKVNIKNFGFLDPSQESQDLPAGSQIELPIWAAQAMSKRTRNFVSVGLPKFQKESYGWVDDSLKVAKDALTADPRVVDLNKMGPQYYQSALQLCALPTEEAEQLSEYLPEVLQKRILAMANSYSLHRDVKSTDESSNQSGNSLRDHHMDPLEVKLFNDSKNSSEELDNWLKS